MALTTDTTQTGFVLTMPDGYSVHLTRFQPLHPRAVLVLHPAMGIIQRYYYPFARFMAQEGFVVITYDYRGMGASAPMRLNRSFKAGFRQLADDAGQIIVYAYHAFPNWPLGAIGHSMGGLFPLMTPHNRLLDSFLMVGTQLADPADFGPGWWLRLKTQLLWFAILPLLTRWFGYFPGNRFRLGLTDMPAQFVQELNRRRPHQPITDFLHDVGATDHHHSLQCPVLAMAATDDPICTKQAMARLWRQMTGCQVVQHRVRPSDVGAKTIGHIRFFSRTFAHKLWPIAAEWFNRDFYATATIGSDAQSVVVCTPEM
jgi:predicted alpha/beta hydrolase